MWYLHTSNHHSYKWVSSDGGKAEPFAVEYGANSIMLKYVGRIRTNGTVFLGPVIKDMGAFYYVDKNDESQNVPSGYEVLTCKSSKVDKKIPPPKFTTMPSADVDTGCIHNWVRYTGDDAPARNGISAGSYDCDNAAYVGKANPATVSHPGRVQIVGKTGVYTGHQQKEVDMTRINDDVFVGKVRPGEGLDGSQKSTSAYNVLTCTSPEPENGLYREETDLDWYGSFGCPVRKSWNFTEWRCVCREEFRTVFAVAGGKWSEETCSYVSA